MSDTGKFDLNIEKILEDWEIYHAIREIIANAIDEQILSNTKDMTIFKDAENKWHIRDYGRGIRYEHLTQKENEEKQSNPRVIGKFGIGLKDALATFHRKGIVVLIKSRYSDITVDMAEKHGFNDTKTLHALISAPSDGSFVGTEVILSNVTDDDMKSAKELFLKFSGETPIEKVDYGEVLEKKGDQARIYINGVKVAEEENFLFSYNITSPDKKIRKALNRERTNVGRGAYSDRVKSILIECGSKDVAQHLVKDLKNYETGNLHTEMEWKDVQERAVQILNATSKVVFITPEEMQTATDMVDEARKAGNEIITIPTSLKERIKGKLDISGSPIRELGQFHKEYNESFELKIIDPERLSPAEKKVFGMTDMVLKLVGGRPKVVKEIVVSETMRKDLGSFMEAEGLWEPANGRIVVKRSVLQNIEKYAGTLLHEVGHARSGASDVTREFELELTSLLGLASSSSLR